jgi:hypothetical protein
MATGGIHSPVKDYHSRPITAGGFVDDRPGRTKASSSIASLEGQALCVNFEPQKMVDSTGPDL